MHTSMQDFIEFLIAQDRQGTAKGYAVGLRQYSNWLNLHDLDPLKASGDVLIKYQHYLAVEYRKADGSALQAGSVVSRLTSVLSYYHYLERKSEILSNPARKLKLPKNPKRVTTKDYLDFQETVALIQTQARQVIEMKTGSTKWAEQYRNLALICLALASGRRRHSLVALKVADLSLDRSELRVNVEKRRPGRVLPIAYWATDVCRIYIKDARSLLVRRGRDPDWLFPGIINEQICGETFAKIIKRLHARTVRENPDLIELSTKHLTPHSLRVSFATLLFKGGCNIRSINELMLHANLSTTARYTPIPFEELQRICRMTHPRG